ncbi:SMI1/KNR4 family protein [Roseibium aggregatum]|uniref:SMI1/KNR4 family protein n=1 Tax=Roseibium aggregatum TaxID=187304 RepID=A0A926S878_9HYPH|nr:SMI1/KNR4 family protein [Roseibium aggregatum]MBD1549546.1 SMI1/KNR4 family protein [Roseibium aggregatum]
MKLKTLFPDGRFWPPATSQEIELAERQIGATLPEPLRHLYLECNGFREPLGNAKYLLSLSAIDSIGSLVSTTLFWREEFPTTCPHSPDFSNFIFFGMSSADEAWAIDLNGSTIVSYHHSMGSEFQMMGRDIIQLYVQDFS